MKTILIVGDPNSRDFVNRAYGDLAEAIFASSVEEAKTLIAKSPPSLVIGTLAFDESRFLTLLPLTEASQVKVVVVDCPYTFMKDEALQLVKSYAKEMNVAAWWDMRLALAKAGAEGAAREIREIVENLLFGGSPTVSTEFS